MSKFKRAVAARLRALAQRLDPERTGGGYFVPPHFGYSGTTANSTITWSEPESRS
jgi:hypothetical protein